MTRGQGGSIASHHARLGVGCKAVLGFVVALTAALIVGSGITLRRHREQVRRTTKVLRAVAVLAGAPAHEFTPAHAESNGQDALQRRVTRIRDTAPHGPPGVEYAPERARKFGFITSIPDDLMHDDLIQSWIDFLDEKTL